VSAIVVNDASCLFDLRKGSLLHVLTKLPHRFIIPFPVKHSEVLDFSDQDWRVLLDGGLEIYDLTPAQVGEAYALNTDFPQLSVNDRFCLVTTRAHEGAILLTGDAALRRAAKQTGLRTHGVLWIIDELARHQACAPGLLITALDVWRSDPAVFLPDAEIVERLRRLSD
jgi:predicted nucleic acid-binding protein